MKKTLADRFKGFGLTMMLAMGLMVLSATGTAQADSKDPYDVVRTVASATFDRMKAEKSQIQQDTEVLRHIVEQELLPYIDHQYSALMVLGPNAKSMSKEKLLEFIEAFRVYLISTYAAALGYYTDQLVEFEPPRGSVDGRSKVTIRALIKERGREDIDVAFKVRFTKDETWKAYDMVAEGVSLLDSKRNEFSSIIRQDGVDAAIQLMREKSQQPIKLDTRT